MPAEATGRPSSSVIHPEYLPSAIMRSTQGSKLRLMASRIDSCVRPMAANIARRWAVTTGASAGVVARVSIPWSIGEFPAVCPATAAVLRPTHYDFGMLPRVSPGLPIDTMLLKPGLRLAVGLSGGADSVALVRALKDRAGELGLVLHAAHLHHGLRGEEADADLEFCRDLAQRLNLPFHEARVDTTVEAQAATGKSSETDR